MLIFDQFHNQSDTQMKHMQFEKEIPKFSMIHPTYLGENRGSFHVDKLNCKHFFLMNDTRHS